MNESHRSASCACCRRIFYVCRSCDRGQVYCGYECRKKGSRHARQKANRHHQESDAGRADHRDRQARYRKRQRQQKKVDAESVTDKGIGDAVACVITRITESSPLTTSVPLEEAQEFENEQSSPPIRGSGLVACAFCGATSQFIRDSHRRHTPRRRRKEVERDRVNRAFRSN